MRTHRRTLERIKSQARRYQRRDHQDESISQGWDDPSYSMLWTDSREKPSELKLSFGIESFFRKIRLFGMAGQALRGKSYFVIAESLVLPRGLSRWPIGEHM
jgi:hypothetical protein